MVKNMTDVKIRLQKFMAESGVASRRKSEELIAAGKVKVNGKTACVGDKVNPKTDKVVVAGKKLSAPKENVYIMLNKPAGYVSATKDNVHPTVVDLIYGYEQYDLFPVGRLDLDTEGLLLLTNDGDFAHKLLAPSRHHSKLYYACVEGIMDENDILKFKEGITIDHYRCQS